MLLSSTILTCRDETSLMRRALFTKESVADLLTKKLGAFSNASLVFFGSPCLLQHSHSPSLINMRACNLPSLCRCDGDTRPTFLRMAESRISSVLCGFFEYRKSLPNCHRRYRMSMSSINFHSCDLKRFLRRCDGDLLTVHHISLRGLRG